MKECAIYIYITKQINLYSILFLRGILGQVYAIYIIAIAGAESAIGLGILISNIHLFNNKFRSLSRLHYVYMRYIQILW